MLLFNFTDTFASYYLSLKDSYVKEDNSLPFYIIDLEKSVNNFLSETECEVMEIQFRTAVSIFGEEQVYCFSAMIVYQEKKS